MAAWVHATVAALEPIVAETTLPLFPEFTDHGLGHIQGVLRLAEGLITTDAWDVLTPGDCAVLVVATICHDAAMHLTVETALALSSDEARPVCDYCHDLPWATVWGDYWSEVSRWDGRRLKSATGAPEPVRVPTDSLAVDGRQKRTLGEMVRRTHGRIAHEVALRGFPCGDGSHVGAQTQIAPYRRDLAGLVARSHTLALRDALLLLERRYERVRTYNEVHPPFLMAVLRIGDYLHLHCERAPEGLFRVRTFHSDRSSSEWRAHQAVKAVEGADEDPEALYVRVEPEDLTQLVKVRGWLTDIQRELDHSWAVIGEVYGRYDRERLDHLLMTLRRVHSNLDDETALAAGLPFVPREFSFGAAGSDLLRLLVGPLYDNKPEVGIRELVQNAVDAVRERWAYTGTHEHDPDGLASDVVVRVEVDADGENGWVVVEDRGIGMTADTINDYYLRAGASYRESSAWRKEFFEDGKPNVMRSGRFGIGVLATFLLGNEAEVSTRHVTAPRTEGLQFRASLDAELLQVDYVARPVGTTVRVRVGKTVLDRLQSPNRARQWDWYCLAHPRVSRQVASRSRAFRRRYTVPTAFPGPVPEPWSRVHQEDYDEILWTFGRAPTLSCNGIIVADRRRVAPAELFRDAAVFMCDVRTPNVAVFDSTGHLPLNLRRDGLIGDELPFHEALADAVARDLVAFALITAQNYPDADELPAHAFGGKLAYSGLAEQRTWGIGPVAPWFLTEKGFGPVGRYIQALAGLRRALVADVASAQVACRTGDYQVHDAVFGIRTTELHAPLAAAMYCLQGPLAWRAPPFPVAGARVVLPRAYIEKLADEDGGKRLVYIARRREYSDDRWVTFASEKCPATPARLLAAADQLFAAQQRTSGLLGEWFIEPQAADAMLPDEPVARAWHDFVGQPLLPLDAEARRALIGRALEAMNGHVAPWQLRPHPDR